MADYKHPFITAFEGTTGAVGMFGGNASGQVAAIVVHWAKTAAQTDGDQIFLMPVSATTRILGIYVANDALTGATDINIGLYNTDETDKDENLFGDAVSIASGSATWSQVDEVAVEDRGKPIYELLGETVSDKTYYLALNLVTGGTAAGDVAVRVEYVA